MYIYQLQRNVNNAIHANVHMDRITLTYEIYHFIYRAE